MIKVIELKTNQLMDVDLSPEELEEKTTGLIVYIEKLNLAVYYVDEE